jgi:hypothetical protein
MAILQGVELRLTLLTTVLDKNENFSLSDIYPDKHEALFIASQIKSGEKVSILCEFLNNNFNLVLPDLKNNHAPLTNLIHYSL